MAQTKQQTEQQAQPAQSTGRAKKAEINLAPIYAVISIFAAVMVAVAGLYIVFTLLMDITAKAYELRMKFELLSVSFFIFAVYGSMAILSLMAIAAIILSMSTIYLQLKSLAEEFSWGAIKKIYMLAGMPIAMSLTLSISLLLLLNAGVDSYKHVRIGKDDKIEVLTNGGTEIYKKPTIEQPAPAEMNPKQDKNK